MVSSTGDFEMSQPIAYGIDFGTSNSSIAVAYPTKEVLLDELSMPGVASLLYLDSSGLELVGENAVQQFLLGIDPTQSRLMASLKSHLADDLFTSTKSWGLEWGLEDLTKVILQYFKTESDRRLDADVKRVLIGYPPVFVGAEGDQENLQNLALERLERAAFLAGFKEVEFLDEPTAALYHDDLESGINLAIDFGAGTFDVSVVRYASRPKRTEVLATHGTGIGGDLFDRAVFNLALYKRFDFESLNYGDPIKEACMIAGMLGLVRDSNSLSRMATLIHQKPRSGLRLLQRIIQNGQAYALSKAVEKAKIKLSQATSATVELYRPDAGIAIQEIIVRDKFENEISHYINQVFEIIDLTLKDAGLRAREVDQVMLTGGSCNIPLFKRKVRSKFSSSNVISEDVASRVALGLAREARRIWS